ncbi:MAG: phosphate ABC transporter substrate-binding protein PstS [bacterium]|nr:phosphate ABC transporter substrate-binding protein PstS [bacterium]
MNVLLKTTVTLLAALLLLISHVSPPEAGAASTMISGAGASFPYPLYAKWAYAYHRETGVKVNYQSIGSGGGIRQIKAKAVDFGASDAPLKAEELDEAGLIQFPMVIGGVVPVLNVEGVEAGALKLTPDLLAEIFLGAVTLWNDPRIAALNPDLALPAKEITVVHRSDGSGTTWIFSNYLDKVSGPWHERVGFGKALDWPAGVGGKGNEGVAAYVARVNGAIGYVEYAYALQNQMAHVVLKNRAGQYVAPTAESFQAAAANADWSNAAGYYLVLTDQPGEESWPITGASFILLHRQQPAEEKAKQMLDFFAWCFRKGEAQARALHYIAMPENVVGLIENTWAADIRTGGKTVWQKPKGPGETASAVSNRAAAAVAGR